MDFLQLSGKSVVVFGVANKKSVAWHIGKTLESHGAKVIYVVRSEARNCLLYTSPSPRDLSTSRMPSSA